MRRSLVQLALVAALVPACARPPYATETDLIRTLDHGGRSRTYILHVPPTYDLSHPVPLVLSLHGGGGNAENQRRLSGFNRLADEHGFIVVYPNGTGRFRNVLLTWNGGTCCGYAQENNVDDVGFIRALVAELQREYAVDPRRIYVTGFSNGGILAYRLACEASDLIAAIAPVAGTLNCAPCQPTHPVSVIHFHGTDDARLPYEGGVGRDSLVGVDFTSVRESVEFWVALNGCDPEPQTKTFADVQHQVWSGCRDGTAVELYTIVGGKHAWPGSAGPAWAGGDEPTPTISASKLIWEFFSAHPKPTPVTSTPRGESRPVTVQYKTVLGIDPDLLSLDIYVTPGAQNAPVVLWVDGGCFAPLDTAGFNKVAAGVGKPSGEELQWKIALGNNPKSLTETSATLLVGPGIGIPPVLVVVRGPPRRQEIAIEIIETLTRAGVPVTRVDAHSLTHNEVNGRIGAPSDTVITPPLVGFLKRWFRELGDPPGR